jgi:uncharacterized protein (UPF0276 family)
LNFALNYSLQAAALLSEGKIEIDRFKCPDWPDLVADAMRLRPVAVHFTLHAGRGRMASIDWQLIDRLLVETGTQYVNVHLEARRDDFSQFASQPPGASLADAEAEAVVEQMISEVQLVTRRYGMERVIAENVPYRGPQGKILRPSVQPEAIRRVLAETGCGLLLDISHARIAARHLGMEERDYIYQLPLQSLRELHFTGLHFREGFWQDHLPALEADWLELEWVLENVRTGSWGHAEMLAFEYGGVGEKFAWRSDPQVITDQVPRLYQMVKF